MHHKDELIKALENKIVAMEDLIAAHERKEIQLEKLVKVLKEQIAILSRS